MRWRGVLFSLCLLGLGVHAAFGREGLAPGDPLRIGGDVKAPIPISPSDLSSANGACDVLLEAEEVPELQAPSGFLVVAPKPGAPPSPTPTRRPVPPESALPTRGEVLVRVVVTTEGNVEKEVEVLRSAHPLYDATAMRSVRKWKFRPATRDGKAVRVFLDVPVTLQCLKIAARQAVWRGNELYQAGQYSSALAKYREAARLEPGDKRFARYVGFGFMAESLERPQDPALARLALLNLKTYVDAYPGDERVRDYLGRMYWQADRFDDAIQFGGERLRQDPKDTSAMATLAAAYLKKGDFPKSVEWSLKRAEALPGNPEPYLEIARSAWGWSYNTPDLPLDQRTWTLQAGFDALDKALAIDPNSFDAFLNLNLLYREKAKYETDAARQGGYSAKADAAREKAMESRRGKSALAPTPAR